jgi:hypothetical protein
MDLAIKILGWGLLIIGVIMIGWTLYSSYNIFTGKTAAPEVFKEEVLTSEESLPASPSEIQKEMEKIIGEQLKKILPVDTMLGLLNLAVWSMLAFILVFGGGQISSLGIKLIKK